MKKSRLLQFSIVLLALLMFSASGIAQRKITGVIEEANNNSPLEGATVSVKNSKTSTTSKAGGKFEITIPNGKALLVISFVGYEAKTVQVATNEESILVKLDQSANQLSDVVVVGYGSMKKKDLTGAVSSIDNSHLNLGGTTTDLGQAIQGRAAGVQVQQTNFSPGSPLQITIRGGNSINTTNAPLYVVDGFITDNGNLINPDDIADIQILKDASAAAIYGSRGGNGVVLITTKKGIPGRVSIDADVSHGTQYSTYKPALLNGQQYTAIQNATAIEDGNPPPFPSSFPVANTDWYKLATQNSTIENRNLSVSSNDKNSKIYVSGSYLKQIGILKNTDYERYSVRIGAEKNLNERIKIGANVYGASSNADLQSYTGDITAPMFSILTAQPNIPPYNPDGSFYRYQGKDNALATLLQKTNKSGNKLINGNAYIDYDIINNLTYHFSAGSEYSQTNAGQYIPSTLVAGQAGSSGGVAGEQMSTAFRWLVENYLTYKYKTGNHSFILLAGTSNQKDITESVGSGSKGFSTDIFSYYNLSAGSLPTAYTSNKAEVKLTDYFGRLNYSYKDKILGTFTLRDDASSRFGPNYRHGLFPSGAVAYKFTDDNFIKDLNIFSNLKARISYGVTGNDRIPNYRYLSTFGNYSTVLSPNGPLQVGIEPSALSNNNLRWESTAEFDAGLDMGFAGGRINATVDYYRKATSDLLINIPIGQWWGFSSELVNAGSIENKGIELSVNSDNIRAKDFSWNTTLNIAYNKQKCLSLSPTVSIISTNTANPSGVVSGQEFTRLVPGKELGELYGYEYDGVIKTGEKYSAQPNSKPGDPKYKDLNGDGLITPADRTYLGNTNPHYMLGFGNSFQYKGFDLNIFFNGAFGYYLYDMNKLVLESTTGVAALDRWVAGTNENTSVPREGYFLSTYGSYVNSRFVENASYIRLKQVSIAYNLPQSLFSHIKIVQGVRIYASAQNLLTITKYTGTDPEVNVHASNNLGGGEDFGVFPAFRTFDIGIKVSIH
jgi:TonB-dependent starch-binding outer membrane protein SusC